MRTRKRKKMQEVQTAEKHQVYEPQLINSKVKVIGYDGYEYIVKCTG